MYKKLFFVFIVAISLISCKQQYAITQLKGTIIAIDSCFDTIPNHQMQAFVQQYKSTLDKEMNAVIGTSKQFMDHSRPESLLTNLTSDVMKAYGDEHLPGGVDLAVMNVNGHRSTMPKGKITIGNLFEIYSFDNTITFLELKGRDLQQIFESYAEMNGAGISSNAKLVVQNRKLISATVDGKPIDDNKVYKIVTLDYLADGNDGMAAFKNSITKENTGITLRDVMIDYVKEQTRQGNEISSQLDGRITLIK